MFFVSAMQPARAIAPDQGMDFILALRAPQVEQDDFASSNPFVSEMREKDGKSVGHVPSGWWRNAKTMDRLGTR